MMRIRMIAMLILAAGITGCRSDSTTATRQPDFEVVTLALHDSAFYRVQGWSPVSVSEVGKTPDEVKRELGPPQPVGDAPPDDAGGWYLIYDTPDGLYRVHYSGQWDTVTKAFKAVLKPEETSEQPPERDK